MQPRREIEKQRERDGWVGGLGGASTHMAAAEASRNEMLVCWYDTAEFVSRF